MKSLVLGGGGSFGSFEAGVLYEIFDKIKFDKIYGTSVGGLNAILMAQSYLDNSPSIIKRLWTSLIKKNKDIYKKKRTRLLFGKSHYDFSPLKKIIKKEINLKEILKMDKQIFLTSCDLITGQSITYSNKNGLSEEDFLQTIISSASIPPLFPPVRLNGRILVDGGIRDNVPLMSVIDDSEQDSILVVLCQDKEIPYQENKYSNILSIGGRVIDVMMNEITKNDLAGVLKINQLLKETKEKTGFLASKKFVNIDVISPGEHLEGESLNFAHETMCNTFIKGIKKGREYLESI